MANNYEQATLSPDIPELTSVEAAILKLSGFGLEKSGNAWYAYVEEGLIDDFSVWDDDERLAQVEADPEYGCKAANEPLWISVLQNVLLRHPDFSHFVLEGALTCDKMRPGEFGGFAILITRDTVKYGGTQQIIRDWEKELGLA